MKKRPLLNLIKNYRIMTQNNDISFDAISTHMIFENFYIDYLHLNKNDSGKNAVHF